MAGIRYYLDEHIAGAVAKGLRRRGLILIAEVLGREGMRGHVEFL